MTLSLGTGSRLVNSNLKNRLVFGPKETFITVLSKCRQPQRVDAMLDQMEEKGRRVEDVRIKPFRFNLFEKFEGILRRKRNIFTF